MPGKVILLVLLSLLVLASTEKVYEQKETYDVSSEISTLFVLWAGDLEGDRVPEILAGGLTYEAAISKGVVVMIRRGQASLLIKIPGTSRTLVMTACDAVGNADQEIVVGSSGLFVYNKTGKRLQETPTGRGDVTALLAANMDESSLDEIVYGTSEGDVVYLVNLEVKNRFSVEKAVEFILHRKEDTFYVVTAHTIYCMNVDGERLWSHTAVGEIHSAVAYDIDDDSAQELVYISGSSIYSLSSDGQKESLIMAPSTYPLAVLVEDVTGEGNPDLLVADTTNRVVIYADLKIEEEIQYVFFGEGADETALLYVANVVGDQKIDLVYGGATKILVFENVVPSEELATRGEQLFAEGEELLSEREYKKARAKFEEAERVFLLAGDEGRAAECREYFDDITDTIERLSSAEVALAKGKQLYLKENFEEAKSQLETAFEEYTVLAGKDAYYQPLADQAKELIDQCDLAIADQYFQNGEELLDQEQYLEAKQQYEMAEAIYSRLESEKAAITHQKIEEIEDMLREEPVEEKIDYFVYGAAGAMIVLLVGVFFATRKKVSAKLEKGHIYLLYESQPKKGLQLVKEYSRLGYEGLVISRLLPEQIRKKKLKKQKVLQLSSASKEDSISPDNVVNILLRMKEFMTSQENSILLLDGLDYIAIQNTFEDAFSLVQKLVESVTLYKGIILVSLNPKSLEEKELVLLEGEMELLEL